MGERTNTPAKQAPAKVVHSTTTGLFKRGATTLGLTVPVVIIRAMELSNDDEVKIEMVDGADSFVVRKTGFKRAPTNAGARDHLVG